MPSSPGKYFIQQFMQLEYLHGGIGCVDAERVLLQDDFIPVLFPHQSGFSWRAKLGRSLFLIKTFRRIKKGAVVVFIFPLYARMNGLLIRLLLKKRSTHFICLVADINGLKDGNAGLLKKEILFFRRFHHFIVHNEVMKQWMQAQVPQSNCSILEFFDFFAKPFTGQRELSYEIAFAGNLEKSSFLEQLQQVRKQSPALHFHLYGPGATDAMTQQDGVSYHGVMAPYEIAAILKGSFGLIWDGDSIDDLSNNLGVYMQYISQHKLSLYILGRLPIIIHSSAASAMLVKKYGIGIVIDELYTLQEKIAAVTPVAYRQMQENMTLLAIKIGSGKCLEEALVGLRLPGIL